MHSVRVCVCVCDVSTLIDYWISQYNSSPTPPSNVLLLPAMPTAQNYCAINFNHSMMIIITTELVLNHMSRSYFCCFQYKIPRNYQSTQSRQSSERELSRHREKEKNIEHRTSNIEIGLPSISRHFILLSFDCVIATQIRLGYFLRILSNQ